jgi:hypothetical protein
VLLPGLSSVGSAAAFALDLCSAARTEYGKVPRAGLQGTPAPSCKGMHNHACTAPALSPHQECARRNDSSCGRREAQHAQQAQRLEELRGEVAHAAAQLAQLRDALLQG